MIIIATGASGRALRGQLLHSAGYSVLIKREILRRERGRIEMRTLSKPWARLIRMAETKSAGKITPFGNERVITAETFPAHEVSLQRVSDSKVPLYERTKERLLIRRLKAGDHRAFDKIFNQHVSQVYRQALQLMGSEVDAGDVVQDVFLTVYKKIKTFREESQFKTWLYRLTVNAALMKLRNNKKRREVSLYDYLPRFQKEGRHRITPVANWFHEVDDPSNQHELQQLLRRALNRLGPQNRAIVLMSDVEGFADREIASILDLSLSAVKARLHRARLFLRGELVA